MLILAINTVQDACEAALVADGQILARRLEPMEQGHDARLGPVVAEVMTETSFESLRRIAVIVGPGSFTGVRVGVAFARGLSLALDIPAVGVTSLEALADMPQQGRILALLPAKRRPPERTWWAQVISDGRGFGAPLEAGEGQLLALAEGVEVVCGGLAAAPDLGRTRIIASPSAVAAAMFVERLSATDLPPPRPVYVREPDAAPQILIKPLNRR